MAKLSLRPTVKSDEEKMQEFINEASKPAPTGEPKPWEQPHVRDDVIKAVSLRMPEKYILMLQYLSEKTFKSQQEILREVVLPFLDREVERW